MTRVSVTISEPGAILVALVAAFLAWKMASVSEVWKRWGNTIGFLISSTVWLYGTTLYGSGIAMQLVPQLVPGIFWTVVLYASAGLVVSFLIKKAVDHHPRK